MAHTGYNQITLVMCIFGFKLSSVTVHFVIHSLSRPSLIYQTENQYVYCIHMWVTTLVQYNLGFSCVIIHIIGGRLPNTRGAKCAAELNNVLLA